MVGIKDSIAVSIASYRDPDLINTVRSAWDRADYKEKLFFSIFSQSGNDLHPDLSFIPDRQLRYQKCLWSESKGVGWARAISTADLHQDFFLQVDAHSRFKKGWDSLIVNNYYNVIPFWGPRIILTGYPDPFVIENGAFKPTDFEPFKKPQGWWDPASNMFIGKGDWLDVENTVYGDEHFFLSAGCFFTKTGIQKEIPYDPEIYFAGEEANLAIRAYTRGIRLISPVVKFMYHMYGGENRPFVHWIDNPDWWKYNNFSYEKMKRLFGADLSLGTFGVGSLSLYKQYQQMVGVDLEEKAGPPLSLKSNPFS